MKQPSQRQVDRIRQRQSTEAHNLFTRLPAAYAASRAQSQRFLQHAGGLSVVEWRTLWDLNEAGPMSIRDLCEIQRIDHSLLSRALPEMKRKGLVDMRRDAEDGRQMIVETTAAGRAAYQKAAPVMKKRREALRTEFSAEDIKTFIALLDRFDAFLRAPVEDILTEDLIE